MQAGLNMYFRNKIYLNWRLSLNRCTQRSTSQALLEVFLDLSQPELQVHPLLLFTSTGFFQLGYTLVQGGLPPLCVTETHKIMRQTRVTFTLSTVLTVHKLLQHFYLTCLHIIVFYTCVLYFISQVRIVLFTATTRDTSQIRILHIKPMTCYTVL